MFIIYDKVSRGYYVEIEGGHYFSKRANATYFPSRSAADGAIEEADAMPLSKSFWVVKRVK